MKSKNKLKNFNNMNELPIELKCHIISFTLNDIIELCTVNKEFAKYVKHYRIRKLVARPHVKDKHILRLINITKLIMVQYSTLTNEGIKNLINLRDLRLFHINSKISDNGISNLTNLSKLTLNESITNDGIKKLTNLTFLDFTFNSTIRAA